MKFDLGQHDQSANWDPSTCRIIDANANRAAEGLRVVEDFLRFCQQDVHLATNCKQLRHRLAAVVSEIPFAERIASRSTRTDIGTQIETKSEYDRRSSVDVAIANLRRVAEALRTLEEFSKLSSPLARHFEQLRYDLYTLEKAVVLTVRAVRRLDTCGLYVLVDLQCGFTQFQARIAELVRCGVGALQLRDKQATDRQLVEAAHFVRHATSGSDTLFFVNDRPDIATITRADGVHVGQEEIAISDAREIVGTQALVGLSTHSLQQAREAALLGADYIGVGPVFPSSTKEFASYPGLDLVREVAAEVSLPAFAIGGIDASRVDAVLQAGIGRVAVSSAVWRAPSVETAAKELMSKLGVTKQSGESK